MIIFWPIGILLPPATKLGQGYFLHLCVILFTGGACVVAGGVCVVAGGVHGCWGACVVVRGHAWLMGVHVWVGVCVIAGGHAWLPGGVCGCQGAYMVVGGCMVAGVCGCWGMCMVARGVCVVAGGMRGCRGGMRRIRRDTVNERAVRILLECILVVIDICVGDSWLLKESISAECINEETAELRYEICSGSERIFVRLWN